MLTEHSGHSRLPIVSCVLPTQSHMPHPISLPHPPTHTHTTLVSCPHPQTMFHLPPLQHHTSHVPSNMLQLAIGPEHLTLGNECCHTHWDIQNYKGDNQQNGDNQHYHGDNHRLPMGQPILQFPANMSIIQIKPRAVVVRCNYETITAAPWAKDALIIQRLCHCIHDKPISS